MRSRALQSLRPIRSASQSWSCIQCRNPSVLPVARWASSTARPAVAPSWKKKLPANKTAQSSTAAAATPSKTSAVKPVPAPPVAEVDAGSEIPTFEPTSTPQSSFAAAIANDGSEPGSGNGIDWSSSFHGLATTPFSSDAAAVLMGPLRPDDVEIKPDGIIYLPEIKYRRVLNQAFGPGGWGLAPRGELVVGEKVVTREYALVAHGRFVAQARGECQYFSDDTIPTAGEGCKSNALMRCCKDLGVASELWDPRFIREFKKKFCHEIWVEHVVNKKKRQIWTRKDSEPQYPYAAAKKTSAASKA